MCRHWYSWKHFWLSLAVCLDPFCCPSHSFLFSIVLPIFPFASLSFSRFQPFSAVSWISVPFPSFFLPNVPLERRLVWFLMWTHSLLDAEHMQPLQWFDSTELNYIFKCKGNAHSLKQGQALPSYIEGFPHHSLCPVLHHLMVNVPPTCFFLPIAQWLSWQMRNKSTENLYFCLH